MDPRHAELARIGLAAVGGFGFALAGGYALAAHGLVDRASEDVDLFTNRLDPAEFARAVDAITHGCHQAMRAMSGPRYVVTCSRSALSAPNSPAGCTATCTARRGRRFGTPEPRSGHRKPVTRDTAMQGYVLLKKSQMAYDERDALRVLTLAQAAQYGPWQLSQHVRAEVTQQEARGLAMLGESISIIEQKLDDARQLIAAAQGVDDLHEQLGSPYNENTFALRNASCYFEVGKPQRAAGQYAEVLSTDELSPRDRGYFTARMASSLALAGDLTGQRTPGWKLHSWLQPPHHSAPSENSCGHWRLSRLGRTGRVRARCVKRS